MILFSKQLSEKIVRGAMWWGGKSKRVRLWV